MKPDPETTSAVEVAGAADHDSATPDSLNRVSASMGGVFSRTLVGHAAAAVASVVLVALATPDLFGAYVLAGSVGLLSSAALAAPMIQALVVQGRDESFAPSLSASFGFLLIANGVVGGAFVVGATVAGVTGAWLVYWMLVALGIAVSSLRFPAAATLQREINFQRLARIQVPEILSFQLGSVAFFLLGLREMSFALAFLASQAIGALLSRAAVPYPRPTLAIRAEAALLMRSSRFFFITAAGLASEVIVPIVLALVATVSVTGLYGWAAKVSQVPLLIPQVVLVVLLPAIAVVGATHSVAHRLFGRSLRLVLFTSSAAAALALAGLPAFTDAFMSGQWVSAIPVAWLLCVAVVIQGTAGVVLQRQYASGETARPAVVQVLATTPIWVALALGDLLGRPDLVAAGGVLLSALTVGAYCWVFGRRWGAAGMPRAIVASFTVLLVALAANAMVLWAPPVLALGLALIAGVVAPVAVLHSPLGKHLRQDLPTRARRLLMV